MSLAKWALVLIIAFVVLYIPLYWLTSCNLGPCESMSNSRITGSQTYHGEKIQCFHGDVVRVNPR